MRKHFLAFGRPLIEQAEIDEVVASMKSGWLVTGPKVRKFQDLFADYKGARFAIAVNSGTAALHLSLLAMDITAGDEVIVPAMTFASVANVVVHSGGRPVFVDCERDTMNIDLADVKRKITNKTKAIIPVHFAGRPCSMDVLMEIAKKHNLRVIEDCAHAVESEFHGKKTGTFGGAGCFSFYATKNITTGEGGMVITDNESYADKIRMLSFHGMNKDTWRRFSDAGYKHYQVVSAGFKYNMMDIQAAMGIHQLSRIESCWLKRKHIWERYTEAFRDFPVYVPHPIESETRHAYHLYTLFIDIAKAGLRRDIFLQEMTKRNIGVGVHYVALHLHPYYQRAFGYTKGDFPQAEWISERTVSLPLSAALTHEDVSDVIEAVASILSR